MRIALSKKNMSFAVLSFAFLMALIATTSAQSVEDYENVHRRWVQEAIAKVLVNDPRVDTDQLLPTVSFAQEIIQTHSFQNEPTSLMTGGGWQLVGGIVDTISNDGSTYALYGRRNLYYEAGLWNNTLDNERSYEDFLVIQYEDNQSKLLTHKKLQPTTTQILIGLRLNSEATGFDVIQNSISGKPQTLWSCLFE